MSILYSNNFNYQLEEQLSNHQQQQQQQQHNLMRYRSAPSSFLENLSHGDGGGGKGSEDYHSFRPSSPEMDAVLSRFMSSFNGSSCEEYEEKAVMKQEIEDSNRVYNVINSTKMNTSVNRFNLARQHSSPPSFFSDLPLDDGFAMAKTGFRVSNGFDKESNTPTSTLGNHLNFSPGQRTLPQIAEIGDDNNFGASGTEGSRGKQLYMDFANNLASNDFKRLRDNDGNVIKVLENQDGRNFENHSTGLTHHLSLPNTAGEMATAEKYLQFQGSVPCKIRAKRGFATHPRSIAERMRRTRISERMRKLQELFPEMDKQVNTADMLDLAVKYIKDLQKQVKTLADTKSKCTCSSKQKLYASG